MAQPIFYHVQSILETIETSLEEIANEDVSMYKDIEALMGRYRYQQGRKDVLLQMKTRLETALRAE